jgi:hypothetical protein
MKAKQALKQIQALKTRLDLRNNRLSMEDINLFYGPIKNYSESNDALKKPHKTLETLKIILQKHENIKNILNLDRALAIVALASAIGGGVGTVVPGIGTAIGTVTGAGAGGCIVGGIKSYCLYKTLKYKKQLIKQFERLAKEITNAEEELLSKTKNHVKQVDLDGEQIEEKSQENNKIIKNSFRFFDSFESIRNSISDDHKEGNNHSKSIRNSISIS